MSLSIQTIRLPETCDRIALCGGPYSNFAAVEGFWRKLMRLTYDVAAVVEAMQQEGLPREFWQSLEQGIWTTCATVLPEAEQQVQPRVKASSSAVMS